MDQKFGALENKFDTLDKNVTSKFDKIMVRLDETHAMAKLGLEGLEGLRESMDAKFEAAAKTSGDQTGLLNSVLVHVRQRVDARTGLARDAGNHDSLRRLDSKRFFTCLLMNVDRPWPDSASRFMRSTRGAPGF